jgi:hypothetical protein
MVVAVIVATVRQRHRWLLVAVAAVVLAWVLAPAVTPIYDGIGNPDEPYRWVKPPGNAKTTQPPTSARKIVAVTGGFSTAQFANTAENGPQLSLYLPPKALQAPAGATSITVTAQPLAPAPPLPKQGTILTNVYRLNATANGKPVPVVGTGPTSPSLQMRAPSAQQPGPVFQHRTATGWQQTRTIRVGVDVYQTQAPALGDWALVQLKSAASSGGSGGGLNWGLLGGGIALLVLAVVVLMVRMRRTGAVTS